MQNEDRVRHDFRGPWRQNKEVVFVFVSFRFFLMPPRPPPPPVIYFCICINISKVTSMAGPLLNVTRSPTILPVASSCPLRGASFVRESDKDGEDQSADQAAPASSLADLSLLIEGVPVSEADITATNGVVHRLSARAMAAPATVAGVLLDPPFPLSAAEGEELFTAVGELVRLAWPLVNETLTAEGPLTVLAPTDAVGIAVASTWRRG